MGIDVEFARMARQATCRGCVWHKPSVTVSGVQDYGTCQVDAPRASSNATWPIVMSSNWCGRFLPLNGGLH